MVALLFETKLENSDGIAAILAKRDLCIDNKVNGIQVSKYTILYAFLGRRQRISYGLTM